MFIVIDTSEVGEHDVSVDDLNKEINGKVLINWNNFRFVLYSASVHLQISNEKQSETHQSIDKFQGQSKV